MSPSYKKQKAQALRRAGASIGAISENLEIAKSTASIWCRKITLTSKAKEIFA
jgi:hypothetical protein